MRTGSNAGPGAKKARPLLSSVAGSQSGGVRPGHIFSPSLERLVARHDDGLAEGQMNARAINTLNRSWWAEVTARVAILMQDEVINAHVMAHIADEEIRGVSIYSRSSMEAVALRLDEVRAGVLSQQAQSGGKVKKSDELTRYIERKVREAPDISERDLLVALRRDMPFEWLDVVDDTEIIFTTGKHVKISSLKDRLSRQKGLLRSSR